MKFKTNSHILKSGSQINIRVPQIEDAQDLLDLKRAYIKNTSTLPLTLEEYPIDVKKEANLIEDYYKSENSILLVAEFNNILIGNIDLTGSQRSKMFHTGMLGMGIGEKWRNQGLGKLLIESVIDWAKHNSKIEIVWLDVYTSNELGYNLYKKTGFKKCGIIKNFFKQDQQYIDKIQMYQRIK
ncbi:hypothetical protein A9Q87_12590 [Flavobacteriales bacterium 34_180_T64]|nr:hypothetical protein A9Q87_12590 [Flavobacteriales bacterium 34_180_T64]